MLRCTPLRSTSYEPQNALAVSRHHRCDIIGGGCEGGEALADWFSSDDI
jgi:hypothetical protein